MSGRLITLPKKSYCPWKPENVERVLRDERRHAEEQAAIQQLEKEKAQQRRMVALKQKSSGNGDGDPDAFDGAAPTQHVNLFAEEEAKATQRQLQIVSHGVGAGATSRDANSGSKHGGEDDGMSKQRGVLPVYLGQSAKSQRDFSKAKHDDTSGSCNLEKREVLRKSRMDPMQGYCETEEDQRLQEQLDAIHRQYTPSKRSKKDKKKRKRRDRRRGSSHKDNNGIDGDDDSSQSSSSSASSVASRRRSRSRKRKSKRSRRHRRPSSKSR